MRGRKNVRIMQTNPDQIADLSAVQELVDRDLFMMVFEESECQIIAFDAKTKRVVAANRQAQSALNANMRSLQRQTICDIAPMVGQNRMTRLLDKIRRRPKKSAVISCYHPHNTSQYIKVTVRYVTGHKDSIVVFARRAKNINAATRKAHLAADRLHSAIDALADGFILFDADDRLVMCNERYREIYKESAPVLVPGAKHEDILRFGLRNNQYAQAHGTEDEWIAHQIATHQSQNLLSEQRLSDGTWLRIVERRTADGGKVGLRMEITHLKDQQDELRRLARTDDLTGQLNRRGLASRLNVLAAGTQGKTRLAVFHIDLDRFKPVNDILGHDAGDFVLQHTAQILASGRPPPDAVARVGGDEFIIIKQTEKPDKTIMRYAQKLIRNLSEPIMFRQQSCTIGASIGVSFITEENAADFGDALTGADIALNHAKAAGGNTVLAYHPEMRAEEIRQNNIAREVQKGIKNNEFAPFFQPQIDTQTNQVVGFEALIRWHHPVLGLVPAFQFLPVAQRAGLTDALDDIVMDRACAAIRDLAHWGMETPHVSINLSMGQISDPRIVSRLQGFMKVYDVNPDQLRIELLESTLIDERSSMIIQNVHALIAAGFMVELDDFGTGHAAIATLRKFAVSRIKVDRSFVQDIDTDSELQVITAALIDLAKRLGINALAEGVETGPEQEMLQQMGCYHAQGYLHARPMPLKDIRPWLQARGDIPQHDLGSAAG